MAAQKPLLRALYDLRPDEVEVSPKLKSMFQVKKVEVLLKGTVRG